ncbi:MAG: M23 family metallopeptidase [Bacteroidales bacterium]|nr:M23 family metallopeptidase [Candidatus Cryptobacteroides caccocaballi]
MSRQNKVEKLRFSLTEEQTNQDLFSFSRTRTRFVLEALLTAVLVIAAIFAIIAYTPVRTLVPGYPDANSHRAAIQTALRVDSLQTVVLRWELYSNNLLRIVEGQEPVKIDSLIKQAELQKNVSGEELKHLQAQDSLLRAMVLEQEQFELTGKKGRNLSIEGFHFFAPLKGVVSQGYTAVTHPWLDIMAPSNSVVMAALDGSVVYSGWSDADRYTVVLQHADNIITIYRHNQKVLVRTGDKVVAGASIALIGDAGTSAGEYLQFELWHKGEAVDPAKYIKF